MMLITLFFTLTSLVLPVLNGDTLKPDAYRGADTVIYHFGDSSVPPQYHRSYTITLTKTEAKLVVDSYGTVLNTSTVKITGGQFNQIVAAINSSKIGKSKTETKNDGCAGGTSESIKIMKRTTALLDAGVYHCGGKDFGDLRGSTTAVKTKLRALFPDIEERLK